MADGAVKAAVDKLEELAMREMKLQSQVGKEVRALKDELEWVSTFLGDADCRRRREVNEYIELWVRQTREVAFDAEDVLEEFFYKGELHCHGCLDLPSLLSWSWRSILGLFVRHSICGYAIG
uniref:Disease resistance N-terminal domain-containing protein n=1 Tax=Arundo donax TaxID=35708 RepID=A0A0A9CIW5_ARUDO